MSNVTSTTATLTIADYSGNWYYKADKAPHNTCSSAQTGSSANLTGLSARTLYTYKAYSASNCAAASLLTNAAAFIAADVSVSNMSEASDGYGIGIAMSNYEATGFTTGDHSSGYTLDRVVIKFRTTKNNITPSVFTAAIHAASGGNPAADATYTLSGNTTPVTAGDYTYTCSGTCSLDKETTYFLVLSGTSPSLSSGHYQADGTNSDSETNTPSDAGWAIANQSKYRNANNNNSTWTNEIDFSVMFEVVAIKNATLSAGSVTTSGATLTIGNHTAQWWYKADKGPHTTCQGPVAANTSSKTLTGLSPVETYTYSAYGASGCADANLLVTAAAFTTGGVSVSNLSETSDGYGIGIAMSNYEATGFTTGDHSSGYTLDRVVIKFRTTKNNITPSVFTAAIHAASGGNPAADATYTLSGNTTPVTAGDYTYTCSGTCSLDKETTYFLVLSGTSPSLSSGHYQADGTNSDSETNTPSDAGWAIANQSKYRNANNNNSTWTNEIDFSVMFEVVATEK